MTEAVRGLNGETNLHGETKQKAAPHASATGLVEDFLDLLRQGDVDAATDLLAEDVRYTNVSLPVVRGRDRVRHALGMAFRLPGAGFEVYVHAISADGEVVLTERTDVLIYGPLRIQFWVCGRFDVLDGEIAAWKDYFDWLNITVATIRGLVGVIVPMARARPPAT